jgi:hypothetical protein
MYIDGIPSFMIKSATAPNINLNEVKIDHINVYRKIKGKAEWQDMTLNLYNPISPSGQQAVMEWIRLSHESVTGRDGYSDFYKKDLTLDILGPVGDVVSEWIIKGAYVKTATFGDYDWTADAAIELSVTIAMDYCILNF